MKLWKLFLITAGILSLVYTLRWLIEEDHRIKTEMVIAGRDKP